ncbi:MAG: exopolysaccharide Pel transporter PelG [bacterium]
MAGIGFRLRKIFEHDTYLDNLRGLIISSSMAGGPIFFSILCLILLGIFSATFLSSQEVNVFLVTIVYIFAFSLISTGMTQLLITRYLSDLIYQKETKQILPTFSSVLSITVISQLLIGLPFLFFWDIDFLYKLTALTLFITIGCIWQLMIFLSAVKNYKIILIAFVLGLCLSYLLAILLGKRYGLTGFLHGYAIGQIFLLFILLARIFIEFRSTEKPDFHFLQYIKIMPHLILIGLFYNLGIWIDKIIFWFSPNGHQVTSFLYAYLDYDGATFFSFLTVIPSYTYFFVKVETDFYCHFRAFFHSILSKKPLQQISEQKLNIANSVKESFSGLIKIQGTIALLCLLFSREIVKFINIPVLGTLILEKAIITVFLQMLLLTVLIFLMYFDLKGQLVVVTTVFLALNILLTVLTLKLGYEFYGYGYLFACLLALIIGYHLLDKHINDLEYHTFVSQPLIS